MYMYCLTNYFQAVDVWSLRSYADDHDTNLTQGTENFLALAELFSAVILN